MRVWIHFSQITSEVMEYLVYLEHEIFSKRGISTGDVKNYKLQVTGTGMYIYILVGYLLPVLTTFIFSRLFFPRKSGSEIEGKDKEVATLHDLPSNPGSTTIV